MLCASVVHSSQIRLAATNALLNSLEFSKQNFEREVFIGVVIVIIIIIVIVIVVVVVVVVVVVIVIVI